MSNFQIFCTGSSGLVASAFKEKAILVGVPFTGIDLNGENVKVNILDKNELQTFIQSNLDNTKPSVLFHFAAATFTGANLTPEQIDLSQKLNIEGTKNVVEVAGTLNIPLVQISTDFVFSGGKKTEPYLPSDPQTPDQTVYAQTKAQAEEIVLSSQNNQFVIILRIAFPYGNLSHPKPDLLKKILTWMDEKPEVQLYSDQHTCPTPISYIADACLKTGELITEGTMKSGTILHVVGQPTTPYAFGNKIKQIFHKNTLLTESAISGKGSTNLVLDTAETERILGMKAPDHETVLKTLKDSI